MTTTRVFGALVWSLALAHLACAPSLPVGDVDAADARADGASRAAFYGKDSFYTLHITSWDPSRMTAASLHDEEISVKEAELVIGHSEPKDEQACRKPAGKQVVATVPGPRFSLRTKGNFTGRTPKPSLRFHFIDANKQDDRTATPLGVNELVLNSMWNDPSQMRETLAWRLFKLARVPSSRTSYARLCINNTYFGLFLVIEPIDATFLADNYPGTDGPLYATNVSDDGRHHADLADLGRDGAAYMDKGVPGKHPYELVAAPPGRAGFDDLARLVAVINGASLPGKGDARFASEAYRNSVMAIFDVHAFLRWAAVNVLLGAWDNYWLNAQNYYLYDTGSKNKPYFHWVPWDYDNTFGIDFTRVTSWENANLLNWEEFAHRSLPLIHNLLANPTFKKEYLSAVRSMLADGFNAKQIDAEIGVEGSGGLFDRIWTSAKLESDQEFGPQKTQRQFTNHDIWAVSNQAKLPLNQRTDHLIQNNGWIFHIGEYVARREKSAREQLRTLK
jgi:hypothetical protein